jgi:hypothetical protein
VKSYDLHQQSTVIVVQAINLGRTWPFLCFMYLNCLLPSRELTLLTSYPKNLVEWGCTTGNAVPVAKTTFYVLKENKAEKIP